MKICFAVVAALCMTLAVGAATKLLTIDPLTGLPLSPATAPGMNLGNEPTALPGSSVCKSKMQGEFYSLFHITTDASVAWYTANLHEFRMVKGRDSQRPQIVFYKPDGTVIVIITGGAGSADAHSVAYERYTPGLSEKTIVNIPQGQMVCP